jgi:hypothetical protein
MKIPPGFIEVTGIGTLRPILLRVDLIVSIGWMWRCTDTMSTLAMVQKIQAEGVENDVLAPPEDALWWTVISTEIGGTFNVVETVEEITNRMFDAVQKSKVKWSWRIK